MLRIPFNVPFINAGTQVERISPNILNTQGRYYELCRTYLKHTFNFDHVILTPSCTSALELAAIVLEIGKGDEVILPSYTFASTANAFALRGAKLKFIDVDKDFGSLDLDLVEKAITAKTKAIVVVHYAGFAINYPQLTYLKRKYKIPIVEDSAQALGSFYNEIPVGSIGDLSTFSFHETKNIGCGQGGALVVNNKKYLRKANSISQCGTDKLDFIKKRRPYYSWIALGSNYLLAEPLCAILYSNLKALRNVNNKRRKLWKFYDRKLQPLEREGYFSLPRPDRNCSGNGHCYYIITKSKTERNNLILFLKKRGIEATFHYYPLHLARFYKATGNKVKLPNTEILGQRLLRLPMFYSLSVEQAAEVVGAIGMFYFGGRG